VLGLIDLTFFQLCDSCLKANSFEDINFGAISLESDRYGITRNTFQANIPGYLVLLQKRKSDSDAEDGNKEAKKKHLKLAKEKEERDKSNYNDLGNMVKNLNQVNDWKIIGSKYKKIFTKEAMTSTPALNKSGVTTYNKWHIQSFCFEKCERKATHKAFLSAPHKAAYDKWVKELKAKIP
jgi:hypothetical protein